MNCNFILICEVNMNIKRVRTLYRVSSKGQVEKDDIPMQKIECRDLIKHNKHNGWILDKEHYEKGISGFLVSSDKRDEVQELLEAAKNKEFDVLLVWKFDRIGRIEDETPFLVYEFFKLGIEIWSVLEGQRKFDTHMDKLTNYLYFWQAHGESQNTSDRITTRKKQLTEAGFFTGGNTPFGIVSVYKGRTNKKELPVKDLEIDMFEAELVKKAFYFTFYEGMGTYVIAEHFNNQGHRTRKNKKFTATTILRMLRNKAYLGYIMNKSAISKHIPKLQIIDNNLFERVQEILNQREKINEEKKQKAFITKSNTLLSGIIFCGHCGGRLSPFLYKNNKKRKDGSIKKQEEMRYSCYHKRNRLCECDGATVYRTEKIDNVIIEIINMIFSKTHCSPDKHEINQLYKKNVLSQEAAQKKRWTEINNIKSKISKLENEIAESLTGQSIFTPQQLSTAIKNETEKLEKTTNTYKHNESLLNAEKKSLNSKIPKYKEFLGWGNEFDQASLERKKMIIGQLIESITVQKEYKLNVQFNISYEEFFQGWMDEVEVKDAIIMAV